MRAIRIRGARTHNLRNIDVDLPLGAFVALTGVSGSGKSSLAIDTIFAEGQRRFLESLPAGQRSQLRQLPRPDVDAIEGLPATICIDQRGRPADRRSTLSTLAGIADFLRVLFAEAGKAHCPSCRREVRRQSAGQIVGQILRLEDRKKVMILAPKVRGKPGGHQAAIEEIHKAGFVRARVDGEVIDVTEPLILNENRPHSIEAVVDRILIKDGIADRVRESVEMALRQGGGGCVVSWQDGKQWIDEPYSELFACADCERSFPHLEPRSFSFNSPYGACESCQGLGVRETAEKDPAACENCAGQRLNEFSRAVTVGGITFGEFCRLNVAEARGFIENQLRNSAAPDSQEKKQHAVESQIWPKISGRLGFLIQVGLNYLGLDRTATSLSGGEYQRVRLAACLGTGLRDACYVLDEPTTGLHPQDTEQLIETFRGLRDQGNSVLVVEHDLRVIEQADWIVDLGPGAGSEGGSLIACGTPNDIAGDPDSVTGQFLKAQGADASAQTDSNPARAGFDPNSGAVKWLALSGARRHNLKHVDLRVPLGKFTVVSGVSGSGKSSLVMETLVPALRAQIAGRSMADLPFDRLDGGDVFEALAEIDQKPIGTSSLSTPATFAGVWDEIRKLLSKTRESRLRGFKAGRFSFNSRDGQCPNCKGRGVQVEEMHFLPDVETECPSCQGRRFNRQTLSVRYRGQSAADILGMTITEARDFFQNIAGLEAMLSTFVELGLGYLLLGQAAPTLSGGEAQRVKLATRLSRPWQQRTLFVLDEPTTGLHPADVQKLLACFRRLTAEGQTVLVVEHHEDVIATADWLVELGPEGGDAGGKILGAGTPRQMAEIDCPTGHVLRQRFTGA